MSEKFIRKADRAAVYYLPDVRRDTLAAAAKKAHLKVVQVETTPGMKSAELLEKLGKVLDFPDWYGTNFDALNDCLNDPDCLPAKGVVLLIVGSAHLHKSDPDGLSTLIEVFQSAGSELHRHGTALWVLLDSKACGVGELPLA